MPRHEIDDGRESPTLDRENWKCWDAPGWWEKTTFGDSGEENVYEGESL